MAIIQTNKSLMKQSRLFLHVKRLVAFSLFLLTVSTFSQGVVTIDQSVTEHPSNYLPPWLALEPSRTNYIFGQEFVPTLSAVDFVEFETAHSATSVSTVQIHADTIDAPCSEPAFLSSALSSARRVTFLQIQFHWTLAIAM